MAHMLQDDPTPKDSGKVTAPSGPDISKALANLHARRQFHVRLLDRNLDPILRDAHMRRMDEIDAEITKLAGA